MRPRLVESRGRNLRLSRPFKPQPRQMGTGGGSIQSTV